MKHPCTLFDKLWADHVVLEREDGTALLWVDRHFVHEGSHHAFAKLNDRGLQLAQPDLTTGIADHYVPVRSDIMPTGDVARMIDTLKANAKTHRFRLFGQGDRRQGIVHVAGPEQGLTLPGTLVVCGDSHTATHGALGAYGFGIGATEVAHVLATQTIWQRRPRTMRLQVDGMLGPGVGAKDMALNWIARLGTDAGRGHAIEYCGTTVRSLSMEGRMTLCNLSIEGGARTGMVAPDDTTFDWLKGRPYAPSEGNWEQALEHWSLLQSDDGAAFDRVEVLNASDIAPVITWGTSPEDALPITATLPDPATFADRPRAEKIAAALDYMGLAPGRPIAGTPIDQVFIGSCTNARIEDLRAAASVMAGRTAKVPGLVSPGSQAVKVQAEQEGLDQVFETAGLEWASAGCSMCVGMNGDQVAPGRRCASTTNRNFRGRQGPGARTHLMSPAMVAAAAVTGTLTDVRPFLAERAAG